ncbi:hypothetical protein SOVF_058760 [Spinacia oleracea]|nr:hypothetical protein SOVF_058760 [Spinacia oleracea]
MYCPLPPLPPPQPPYPPPPPPPHSIPFEWTTRDLKTATLIGNVGFLKASFASKVPLEYYKTTFQVTEADPNHSGNIFHLSVLENREEFIRVAIQNLPPEAIQQLLNQPRNRDDIDIDIVNPLYLAVLTGNFEIVKLFLNVFRTSSALQSPSIPKPWLITVDNTLQTLCHIAILNDNEECALEILTMDMDYFCNAMDINNTGVLYYAMLQRFTNFVLHILRSDTIVTYAGFKGTTPLNVVTRCSVDSNALVNLERNDLFFAIERGCHEVVEKMLEIVNNEKWSTLLTNDHQMNVLHLAPLCTKTLCERFLQGHPKLLEGVDKNGTTVMHSWVIKGEL